MTGATFAAILAVVLLVVDFVIRVLSVVLIPRNRLYTPTNRSTVTISK